MKTIRSRLLLSMLITGLVPLLAVITPMATVIKRNLLQDEEGKLAETSRQLGRLVAEVTDRTARELSSLQSNPLLANPESDIDIKVSEMHRLVKIYEVYSDISLYDADGFLLCSTAEDLPSFREYSDWFRDAIKGKVTISQPQRVIGREGLFLTVFLPVKAAPGPDSKNVSQVLKARLSFARILSLLDGVKVGGEGCVYLLDSWGNTLFSKDSSRLMEKFDPSVTPSQWVEKTVGEYTGADKKSFLYASEVLPASVTNVDSNWVVISMKPLVEVTAMVRQSIHTLLIAGGCMIVVACLLGLYLSGRMSRPLEDIGRVARRVAGGDLGVKASEDGGSYEAQVLAKSFNSMIEELALHREGLENLVATRTASLNVSQSELEQTSARLQAAIASTNNGFLVEDMNGEISVVNHLFLGLLGLDPDAGGTIRAAEVLAYFSKLGGTTPEMELEWRARRAAGASIDCEIVLTTPIHRVLHVYSAPVKGVRGNLVGRVWCTQDFTEQRLLEEGLRQSQKMEAVGQLAGGVAHDFNNLLAGILGNLALVQMDASAAMSGETRESLGFAIKAGERAAELVRQLLGFSRRSHMDLKPCDVNLVLAEVRDLLTATIDPRISIDLDLESSPWRAVADVGMLGQVIMNMAVNAKDAMPKGGKLTLRSGNRSVSEAELLSHPEIAAGDFICLSVEDQGEGIPPEVQAKIFEPFFTTKDPGKGTGLGLATSFGIVNQLGGWIDFISVPGEGTRFDIFLPRNISAESAGSLTLLMASSGSNLTASRAGETILLVDDEALVRRIGRTLLTKLGYEVVEAKDGLEALEICRKQNHNISLVLLDLTMPNLTGKETFAGIHEILPDLPVLICSGYLVDLNEFTRECGYCPDGFVQKPYSFEDMADIVRKTLDHQVDMARIAG
jgi:two-component system cell cycle sensor histidine kinase/response regulator CckA